MHSPLKTIPPVAFEGGGSTCAPIFGQWLVGGGGLIFEKLGGQYSMHINIKVLLHLIVVFQMPPPPSLTCLIQM